VFFGLILPSYHMFRIPPMPIHEGWAKKGEEK
jgi:hypothetical protein